MTAAVGERRAHDHSHDNGHHDHSHGDGHDHGHGHGHHHGPPSPEAAQLIWDLDHIELTTVGIDIGSATSHVMFARVVLERQSQTYDNRFVVAEREVLYQSPITFTGYSGHGQIDVAALREFIASSYQQAGLAPADVDAGAVILTGVALERTNSRAIADLFAEEGGKFVCATAGHNLEALLAAHGSGAVALSERTGEPVLNIDVGGGTTKLTLAEGGAVRGTLALPGGGRLLAWAADGTLHRVEESIRELTYALGIRAEPGLSISEEHRGAVCAALADRIVAAAQGRADPAHVLAGELPVSLAPKHIVMSGGVAAYLAAESDVGEQGDLGHGLAAALRRRLTALDVPVSIAVEPMRATVIGASQFSVQISGNTVHAADALLPIHNVPVLFVPVAQEAVADDIREAINRGTARLNLQDREDPIAVGLHWHGEPNYRNLRAIADGIAYAHQGSPRAGAGLVVCVTADVAASLGAILTEELELDGGLVVIDGVTLGDLDFLDIGQRILPANVLPVMVKSLLFPTGAAHQPLTN